MLFFFVILQLWNQKKYILFFTKKNNKHKDNSIDDFIRIYEFHKEIIESEENHFYQRIRIDFAIYLSYNEEYTRAVPLLNKNIEILTSKNYDNPLLVTESYLKGTLFEKGKSFYYTRKLNESQAIFNQLHIDYPNNDIYKDWLKSSIHFNYQKFSNYLWIIVGASLFLNIILGRLKYDNLEFYSIIIGLISIILIGVIHLLSKLKQNKIK